MGYQPKSICHIDAHLSTGDVSSIANRLAAAGRQTLFPRIDIEDSPENDSSGRPGRHENAEAEYRPPAAQFELCRFWDGVWRLRPLAPPALQGRHRPYPSSVLQSDVEIHTP